MEYTDTKHERTSQLRIRLSSPRQAIQQHIQKADNLSQLLKERFRSSMNQKHNHSLLMNQRLRLLNPQKLLGMHQKNIELLSSRLPASIENLILHRRETFHSQASLLESLSPLAVLHRGFSLNQKEDGSLLKSDEDVETGEAVKIRLEDGELKTKVLEKQRNLGKIE